MTEQIGVRELRQAASVHLRAVAAGEEFIITDRGRPVARLAPLSPLEARVTELIAQHGLQPPTRPRRTFTTTARLPRSPLSTVIDEDRTDREVLGA